MKAPSELNFKLHKLSPYPLADAMPINDEFPIPTFATNMSKAKKVEHLWFALAFAFAVVGGKTAKLDQPSFALVKLQVELRKSLLKFHQKSFGIFSVLKADHKVVAKPDNDNISTAMLTSPLLSPQIQHIVQVDIGKQRTDTSALRYAFLAASHRSILKHARIQPLLNVAQNALVCYTVLDELRQPFVVDGIKITPNVCIQHPAHLSRHDPCIQGVERIMRTAPGAKTIRESDKVRLINRVQHLNRRALDYFIFQHRHAQWPLSTIWLGDVRSFHRLCTVRSALQSPGEVLEILFQLLAVMPPRLNAWPARPPTNASRTSLRKYTHGSEPV